MLPETYRHSAITPPRLSALQPLQQGLQDGPATVPIMKAQTFLQLPPQLVEDSASNNGSSVAGDCFDDDFLSDAGRESPSNADSLAEDSDDEAVAVSSADMARLRAMAMSYDRSRDRRCDCDNDNDKDNNQHNTNDGHEYDQGRTRPRTRQRPQLRIQDVDLALDMGGDNGGDGDGAYQPLVSILPRGTKPVRLVGEGAANAVFEIKLPPGSRVGAQFQGTLARESHSQLP